MVETIPEAGELLERSVASVMRHGVISVAEDASLISVARAMKDHRVHAVLIEQRSTGRPLGWAKADTLLSWLNMRSPWVHAHQAITEPVTTIQPTATVREAMSALLRPGTSRLLVCGEDATAGEGVLAHLDVIELLTSH